MQNIDSDSGENISDRALALDQQNNHHEALKLHKLAYDINSDNPNFVFRLGLSLLKADQKDLGLSLLRRSVALNPGSIELRAMVGQALVEHNDPLVGLSCYEEIVSWRGSDYKADTYVASFLLAARRPDLAFRLVKKLFPACQNFLLDEFCSGGPGQIKIDFTSDGYVICFTSYFSFRYLLNSRLISLMQYIEKIGNQKILIGSCVMSLDDHTEGSDVQLCFSGTDKNHILVPDPIFIERNSYDQTWQTFSKARLPWAERKEEAYWRGSLTGYASSVPDILCLPRVEVCLIARSHPNIDAKINRGGLNQYLNHQPLLGEVLDKLALLGDFEEEKNNLRYKYLLEIDGNTNSWPGLFVKLASAGCAIKLVSPYRQWFYDRLIPKVHFFPIDNLSRDLPGVIDWLSRNDKAAEDIGLHGQELAASLTVASEFESFSAAVERAVKAGAAA